MQKVSKLYKTLVLDGEISLAVLDTTALVQEAIARHGLSAVAAAALGRTLTATAYLSSWLKEAQSTLSVTIDGRGAGGKISVSGDGGLHLRGNIANPGVELPPRADGKLDVGGCVGANGTLTVVRDDGEGLPFVGTCALVSGEIAEDFSAYFLTSEQRPTALALGVKIGADGNCLGAGGVFLQPLPNAREEHISFAESEIAKFAQISTLIEQGGAVPVLRSFGAERWEERDVVFRCRCSRERAARALVSLGKEDAEKLIEKEGAVSVHCHDCNTDYIFGREDVEKLFRK